MGDPILQTDLDWTRLEREVRELLGPMVRDLDDLSDITQNCLIKIWRGSGTFEGRSSFSTWLFRVVRNEFLSWERSAHRYEKRLSAWSAKAHSANGGPEREVLDRIAVERLLADLPDQDRRLLELHYLRDWTSINVGDVLGLASSTVRCRVRTLKQLCGK